MLAKVVATDADRHEDDARERHEDRCPRRCRADRQIDSELLEAQQHNGADMNIIKILNEPRVEPVKRNKDGVRWIVHRFPIKGGISLRQSWLIDLAKPPP